jgi:DMSO/TMAO reductase YedYZ molybdopterin-dependent catalytic subunit
MPDTNPNLSTLTDEDANQEMRRLTRRSFITGAAAGLAGLAGWLSLRYAGPEDGLPWPLRRVLELNERLANGYFRDSRLAPSFPAEQAGEPRVNGSIGLARTADLSKWRLHVRNEASSLFSLTLADIKALPRVKMVTELKCVEGWSQVVSWTGVSLGDFAAHYKLATRSGDRPDPAGRAADLLQYAGLATPDGSYFVGMDAKSVFHPQTLLAYEMNGQPLNVGHGAPLRLISAVKYGYKSLKCVGTITFTDRRPPDYWAQRGYDWYAGH